MIGMAFWIAFWLIVIIGGVIALFLLIMWIILQYNRRKYGRDWFDREDPVP